MSNAPPSRPSRVGSVRPTVQVATPLAPPDGNLVKTPATSARLSRDHEKNEIASLNDRFAAIIERQRNLESTNKILKHRKSQLDETAQRTAERIKTTYEKELAEIRAKGNVLAEEVAELRGAHTELELEYNETKTKLDELNKAETPKKRQVIEMKKQVQYLTGAITQVQFESTQIVAEKINLEQDREAIAEEIEAAKDVLKEETVAQQDRENALKSKLEELKEEDQLHQEELKEIESERQHEIKRLEDELRQRYEYKLQERIGELRAEYDKRLQDSAYALEARRGEMGCMKTQLKQTQDELHNLNVETMMLKGQLDVEQKKITDFENEKRDVLQSIDNMEKKSCLDHAVFGRMLKDKDEVIDAQVAEKDALVNDTQLLMSAKAALDNEIGTYRKLLDAVEPASGPAPVPQFTFPPKP